MLALLVGGQDAPIAEPELVQVPRPLERRLAEAEALGQVGDVTVEVTVDPDGLNRDVTVVTSSRSNLLDAEAVRLTQGATFRTRVEPVRYRLTVSFKGLDEAMTCQTMARQARWWSQTWPERPLKDVPIYSVSQGLLLLAGMPETPNREAAQAQGRRWEQFETAFPQLVEACEREPERTYFPLVGAWARGEL